MGIVLPNPVVTVMPAATGRVQGAPMPGAVGAFRKPTDALALISLTFDGVNANSEIRAYLNSDGSEVFGVESCNADHVFTGVAYYGTGQTVTIKIVHPNYRIKEFEYDIPSSSQILPIQQEPDKWYSNPA